jgi:Flp pilus assembly protein TadB
MIKKVIKWLNPYYDYKKQVKNISGEASLSVKSVKSRYSRLFEYAKQRKKEGYVSNMSYDEMLYIWGINPDEVPLVIRGMKIELASFSVLTLFSFLVTITLDNLLFSAVFSTAVFFIITLFFFLNRGWRIHCLKNKVFIPYKVWLSELFFVSEERGDS